MTSNLFEPILWVGIFGTLSNSALLITQHLYPWETALRKRLVLPSFWIFVGWVSLVITGAQSVIWSAAFGLIFSLFCGQYLGNYYIVAQILLPTMVMNFIGSIGWGIIFIQTSSFSVLTKSLLMTNLVLLSLTTFLQLIYELPVQSFIFRKRWRRPRYSLNPEIRSYYPKVSFHVPCYAEPPDVVCATLDALNQMRYPNFEVLVIDNNTTDPALWQPVERYCKELNTYNNSELFRFFHIEQLSGAKAGALNFALRHTYSDVELIALVDSDYQAQSDFLERLVGFFDDPNMGYVQTPHDYRDWETNLYQRACYWEYMSARARQSSFNEWIASITIGTMCLIRRSALEDAGGWDESCVTEDAELAVRIHALGYASIYLKETFGRGLIPETFRSYKKQRLRWSMGPIQIIQKHWHLYLPDPWATTSKLSSWQRLFEIYRGYEHIKPIFSLVFFPLSIGTLSSIIYHQETIKLPLVILLEGCTISIFAVVNTWLQYRLLGCNLIVDIIYAMFANRSLQYVRFLAPLIVFFANTPIKWQRTNKFNQSANKFKAFKSTQTEFLLALILIFLGLVFLILDSYTYTNLSFVPYIFFWYALPNLFAPLMALLAEYQLSKSAEKPKVSLFCHSRESKT
jgi:cellulose synthase/poly-beta-1,6-N-acetylglucosamine synthase-like glycosyltransferase